MARASATCSENAASLGLPHVIPWGLGKWFFSAASCSARSCASIRKPTLFLGDEGGRPGFWPYPSHFREGAGLGVRDLPGTDPLPFPHDVSKVGRVGIRVPITLDEEQPARSLLTVLCDGRTPLDRFASLEPPSCLCATRWPCSCASAGRLATVASA